MVTHALVDNSLFYYRAIVQSVYDADTIRADIDFGFGHWSHNIPLRLHGINAPEVRGKEKKKGRISRDALRARIGNDQIIVRTHKSGKYGRYLAEIWHNGVNINEWLVEQGYAEYKEY